MLSGCHFLRVSFDEVLTYDVCELRRAGLVLQETEACIAAVKERVALYVMNRFGSDNKETLSQLFGSFFIKVGYSNETSAFIFIIFLESQINIS